MVTDEHGAIGTPQTATINVNNLQGGDGDDTLYGTSERDIIIGGGRADNFVQIVQLLDRTDLTDEEALETTGNLITV